MLVSVGKASCSWTDDDLNDATPIEISSDPIFLSLESKFWSNNDPSKVKLIYHNIQSPRRSMDAADFVGMVDNIELKDEHINHNFEYIQPSGQLIAAAIPRPRDIAVGTVSTKSKNMIIRNNNNMGRIGEYAPYCALSYVSSGSVTNTKFEIEDVGVFSCRYANDRNIYKAVMESNSMLIWTDYISLADNYTNTREKMRAIGKAYYIADSTIAVLSGHDADVVKDIVEIGESLSNFILNDEKPPDFIDKYITRINDLGVKYSNRNEFSYWARAWTLQEQHQSQTMEYGELQDGNKYTKIIDSRRIIEYMRNSCGIKSMTAKDLIETDKYDTNFDILLNQLDFIKNMWKLLSGREKLVHENMVERRYGSMDRILIDELTGRLRCARNKEEFNEAVAIALNIFVEDDSERWKRILGRFVDNGFIPVKKYFGLSDNNRGWLPESCNKGAIGGLVTNQYYSFVFQQFIDVGDDVDIRAVINEKGSMVLKSRKFVVEVLSLSKVSVRHKILSNIMLLQHNSKMRYKCTVSVCKDINLESIELHDVTIVYNGDLKVESKMLTLIAGKYMIILGNGGKITTGTLTLPNNEYEKLLKSTMYKSSMEDKDGYFVLRGSGTSGLGFY